MANSGGGDKVVVGHSLWKASGVDSDQTLPVRIAKHDPLDTAKAMVGVSIALGSKYACCPAASLRESQRAHQLVAPGCSAIQVVVVDIFANKCQG